MKLITEEIKKKLAKYPLYSQDGKGKEAVAVAKFFLSACCWTWYITEASKDGNTLFGVCITGEGEAEYGYFSLQELQSIRTTKVGLKVERDIYFTPKKLVEIDDDNLKSFLSDMYD